MKIAMTGKPPSKRFDPCDWSLSWNIWRRCHDFTCPVIRSSILCQSTAAQSAFVDASTLSVNVRMVEIYASVVSKDGNQEEAWCRAL
jgi:hypothetical protein